MLVYSGRVQDSTFGRMIDDRRMFESSDNFQVSILRTYHQIASQLLHPNILVLQRNVKSNDNSKLIDIIIF